LLEPEPDAPGESQAARDESDLAKPQVPAKPPAASAKSDTTKPRPPATDATQKPKSTIAAAPKPVPKGLSSWVVQVAALSTPEAAQRLQSDLRSKGFHAFVEKAEGASRTLWRVRVGPEVERKRAEALATDVKKRTGHDAVVQKYRDG
jgi:DedD protein